MDMAITTGLVEAFLKCPTKCFLRARVEVGTGNAYADWVRTENDVFRTDGIKRLVAGVAPDKCATGTAATETGRSAQWRLALDFVARSENLRCSCKPRSLSPFGSYSATSSLGTISFYWHSMPS